jgi:drug/metabolite transporter (DMT)-like permease
MKSSHSVGLLMSFTAASFWGVVPIILKYLVSVCNVETIIWFRFTISFLFLAVVYAVKDPAAFRAIKKPPFLGILAGLALAGNYFGHTTGVHPTSPSNAQVISQIGPLLLAVAGVVYFKERLNGRQKLGIVLALIGFLFFYWDQIRGLLIDRAIHMRGDLWIVFGAVVWAFFAVSQKMLVRRLTPQQANLIIYGVAALFFFPQTEFRDFGHLSPMDWSLLGFMAANTLIAYGALAVALKLIPANQVAVILVLNPLVTLVCMAVLAAYQLGWLGIENISFVGYLGAGALLAGVGLVVAYSKQTED